MGAKFHCAPCTELGFNTSIWKQCASWYCPHLGSPPVPSATYWCCSANLAITVSCHWCGSRRLSGEKPPQHRWIYLDLWQLYFWCGFTVTWATCLVSGNGIGILAALVYLDLVQVYCLCRSTLTCTTCLESGNGVRKWLHWCYDRSSLTLSFLAQPTPFCPFPASVLLPFPSSPIILPYCGDGKAQAISLAVLS